ncbi:hypothetical protein TorRG33x02_310760 [Trema orientale]|uniref:Uncharacterized protein n=1 Tax=Trema orientale TaxID=63057 RepID=A0A2P5BSC4_TREOI|nr:hypothetical protein TorRG33x02_310760 [Trema orientale]
MPLLFILLLFSICFPCAEKSKQMKMVEIAKCRCCKSWCLNKHGLYCYYFDIQLVVYIFLPLFHSFLLTFCTHCTLELQSSEH